MKLEKNTYPPLNMHFVVEFDDESFFADMNFQSIQGLQARIVKNESNKEGHAEFENIILKRAYRPSSNLIQWCMLAINHGKNQSHNLIIKLLNAQHDLVGAWQINQAIPIGWGVEELHAQDTKILIERIELKYQYFQVIDGNGIIIAPVDTDK